MKMNERRKLPEGFMAACIVLMGLFAAMVVAGFVMIKVFASEEHKEEIFVTEYKKTSLEKQFKHDIDMKFQEWMEEQETEEAEEPKYLIDVTQEDIDLMARVVMSEASILSYDAKQAIAQTIVNRVRTDFRDFRNQNSVSEVVYHPNAYSTQDNGEPNEDCYRAVEAALMYEGFPTDMFWFREDHYHNFGTPYCHIGTTYFSRGISDGN